MITEGTLTPAAMFMVITDETVVPAKLVIVTVNVWRPVAVARGVPVIAPVLGLMLSPAGRRPLVTAKLIEPLPPDCKVWVKLVPVVPGLSVTVPGRVGIVSTVSAMLEVPLPALLVAVIVAV